MLSDENNADAGNDENFQNGTPTTKRCRQSPLSPLDLNTSLSPLDLNELSPNLNASNSRAPYKKRRDLPIEWARGRRLSGNYRDFFAEVLAENGEATDFVACVHCDYICAKSSGHFGQMREHRKKHNYNSEIEKAKKDFEQKQMELGLRGRPFLMLEDKAFVDLLNAFGTLKTVFITLLLPSFVNTVEEKRPALPTRILRRRRRGFCQHFGTNHQKSRGVRQKSKSVKNPTINLIVPRLASFERHLEKISQEFVKESPETTIARTIKVSLERKLNKSMNIDLIKAAAFLDPFFMARIHSIGAAVPRWGSFESFREATSKMFQLARIAAEETYGTESNEPDEFPRRLMTPSIDLELNAYMTQSVDKANYDVLNFWDGVGKAFPLLRQLALKILAIPASISHSERSFSKLRMLYNSFRRSIGPDTISSIICLGSLDFDIYNDDDDDNN